MKPTRTSLAPASTRARRPLLRAAPLALLLLTACGDPTPTARGCDRIGLLCANNNQPSRLGLASARGSTADLDGDGQLDLITAAPPGLSIAWSGTSQRDYHLEYGSVPDAKIGDLDDDGDPDIVFLTADPPALHTLTSDRTRTLRDGPTLALAGRPQGLWIGQLDADDALDAVVASDGEGTITVITDRLTRAAPIAVGVDLSAVTVADFNGDARLDILATDRGDAALYLALADGDRFAAPRRFATGLAPEYLQALDFDGDTHPDVLTHGKGADIWFHQGDGAGSFASARSLVVQKQASEGFAALRDERGGRWLFTVDRDRPVASEVDADDQLLHRVVAGHSDIDGLDLDGATLLTHGPREGQRHALASSLLLSELWYTDAEQLAPISFADLDLDGALDLLVIQDDELLLHHELPDRSWSEYARFTVPERVVSLVVRDINADGKPDLVLGDATPALTAAIAGPDSSFTLGPTNLLTATPSQLHSPATAATALIATTHDPDPLVTALRLDPTGLLVEQTPLPIAGDAYGLSSADIDADGDADLVLLTLSGPELVTSLVIVPADADGWGSPQTRELSALLPDTDFNNATLALGDLDLDGTIDAAILTSSAIVRLMNIGAALPPPPRVDPFVNNGGTLGTAVIAEVDGTGRPDIVHCAYLGLQIVLTTSDGELQPQAQLERIATSCAFHVDPNDLSLRVAAGDGDLSVFEPAFAPALTTLGEFNGGPKPLRRLELGDLDADGHLDIVVADEGSSGMESVDSTSSFAVLWGAADSLPTRATWQAGRDYQTAEIALAPLDDRPGDELVVAWSQGQVDIWTHQDGALALLRTLPTDFTDLSAVAIQRHPRSPSNIILLGHLAPDQWTVAATDLATGALTPLWTADSNDEPALLTVADLDHDGHDDLAVIPRSFAPVQLLWGGPERTTLGPTIELLPAVAGLHAADMNGDGTPELVLASEAGVLAHDLHTRVVGEPVVHVASSALQGLLLADLEGDGRADILRTSDHDLNVTLRAPTGDDRVQLTFNPTWSVLRAAHLDDDEILDLIGLRNGAVTSRLSAPQ